jgi:DNA-binding transcriptional ArsR family regulator
MSATSTTRAADLDRVYAAIADPTRRAILTRLLEGPATVGELARPFAISAPAISKHLRVLERAGLMTRRVEGRVHHCQVVPATLEAAEQWLADRHRFWDRRLAALRKHLDGPDSESGAGDSSRR